MTVIDLSHPLWPGMPVYPGTAPPDFREACTLAAHGFAEKRLGLSTHTGTHVDVPAHVLSAGATLDRLPAAGFVGPGQVLDVRRCRGWRIRVEDLAGLGAGPGSGGFVLLWTGLGGLFGDPGYFRAYPALDVEAARHLTRLGLAGIGVDACSVDAVEDIALPAHQVLLGAGLCIVENLTGLERLPQSGFTFVCLPLCIAGGDGSPVRAVALVP